MKRIRGDSVGPESEVGTNMSGGGGVPSGRRDVVTDTPGDQESEAAERRAKTKVLVVAGPTAAGKSDLALSLCDAVGGEIVNADAVQLYRGLDIATNKPDPAELARAPHHLVAVLPPSDTEFNATAFVRRADEVIADITARGKVPVVVGGTHYYVQKLLLCALEDLDGAPEGGGGEDSNEGKGGVDGGEGNGEGNGEGKETVEKASVDSREGGSGETPHERLRRLDPEMATRWHPHDTRRILNSIAVIERTGRKHSDIVRDAQSTGRLRPRYDACILALLPEDPGGAGAASADAPDPALGSAAKKARRAAAAAAKHNPADAQVIRSRIDRMVERGIGREVYQFFLDHDPDARDLPAGDGPAGSAARPRERGTVLEAIGYREFKPWCAAMLADSADRAPRDRDLAGEDGSALVRGCHPLFDAALDKLATTTRRYAKKQVSWVRTKLLPCDAWRAFVFPARSPRCGPERFADEAIRPAAALARAFLRGALGVGEDEAAEALASRYAGSHHSGSGGMDNSVAGSNLSLWGSRTCAPCGRKIHGEHQWLQHVRSRQHKRRVSKVNKADDGHPRGSRAEVPPRPIPPESM